MKISLSEKEIEMLTDEEIDFNQNHEYTEDEAFELLEQVRDVEVYYSQDLKHNEASYQKYIRYGDLADKIQDMISEE